MNFIKKKNIYYYKQIQLYNISNIFKKIFNYIIYFFFEYKIKKKTLYLIEYNEKYNNFLLYIKPFFNIILLNNINKFIFFYDININKYDMLKNFITKKINQSNNFYIYKIKIDKKYNFNKNIEKSLNNIFNNNLDKYNHIHILNELKILEKKNYNIYQNIPCIKILYYIYLYNIFLKFLDFYKSSTNIIIYKNNVFLYNHDKKLLLETYKHFILYLKNNNLIINSNKTYFIDKKNNNLIFKNQILTFLNNNNCLYDDNAKYLLKNFKKNNHIHTNPLLIINDYCIN